MRAWKIRGIAIAIVIVMLAASSSLAREAGPTEWPLERIVANLETRLREAPDDVEAHYNLGRALAFAFALEASSLRTFGDWVRDLEDQPRSAWPEIDDDAGRASEMLAHLTDGVTHLRIACELQDQGDRPNTRKHLTLAWLLETGAHLADRVDTVRLLGVMPSALSTDEKVVLQRAILDLGSAAASSAAWKTLAAPENLERAVPLLCAQTSSPNAQRQRAVAELLERYWIERSIAGYWRALELAFESDMESTWAPRNDEEMRHMVSYEALEGYCRLVQARGVQSPEEEQRLAEAADKKLRLEKKPRASWITPIVLTLGGCKPLDELVTPNLTLPFDLDGDGIDELWPWIAPDAGWLVWDPQGRGEITSGRQLFGTASAWLFFDDGYRVLDALDDDRDGTLTGLELSGIAVWFDRDTDGISDRGEVIPVEELGIVTLSTQATERIGRSLANPCGLELSDGRILPTYDWVLAPVTE